MATELLRAKREKELRDWRARLKHAQERVVELNKSRAPFKEVRKWQESCEFCVKRVKETEALLEEINFKPDVRRMVSNWKPAKARA